jgi:cell wall-associated NlpC family hydrolase
MRVTVGLFLGLAILLAASTALLGLALVIGVAVPGVTDVPGGAVVGAVPVVGDAPGDIGTPSDGSAVAARAVSWALSQRGVAYRWGGEGSGGFDCSGLVQAAFAAAGVHLPRVAQDQYDAGPPLPDGASLEPGDLVFFGSSTRAVDHVGIVVSTGEMVDAPHTGAVVRVEPIFSHGYVGATRPAR